MHIEIIDRPKVCSGSPRGGSDMEAIGAHDRRLVRFNLLLPEELLRQLRDAAQRQDRPMVAVVRRALRRELGDAKT
jgi:hypothetical protein